MMTDSTKFKWKGWNRYSLQILTFLPNQTCHGPLIPTILQGNLKYVSQCYFRYLTNSVKID